MQDDKGQFHEFATQSVLFRGRADWYYCYLKTERLAQVLWVLSATAPQQDLSAVTQSASKVPDLMLSLAAHEVSTAAVLRAIFSVMSALTIAGVRGVVRKENVTLLIDEYQLVARRVGGIQHPSPYLVSSDLLTTPESLSVDYARNDLNALKDTSVAVPRPVIKAKPTHQATQAQGSTAARSATGGEHAAAQSERALRILELVQNSRGVSIKDLTNVVRDVSEKTIQRELASLVSEGKILKVGERRWSQYVPVDRPITDITDIGESQ